MIKKKKKEAAGAAWSGSRGVKWGVPGRRAPRLCPGTAARRERGANRARPCGYLRVICTQGKPKAAETRATLLSARRSGFVGGR